MARRALLLDLNGTLWDSRPWHAEIMAQLSGGSASRYERALEKRTSVVQLLQRCGTSRGRFATAAKEGATSLAFHDGVRPTLDELRKRGTSMGVVANLPGWLVAPMAGATGIDEYFDVIAPPPRAHRRNRNPTGRRCGRRDGNRFTHGLRAPDAPDRWIVWFDFGLTVARSVGWVQATARA